MLTKMIISFLCGLLFLYILLCLFLNTPIAGGGGVKELSEDIKHRWFWVMSIYIGKIVAIGFLFLVLTIASYVLIFG